MPAVPSKKKKHSITRTLWIVVLVIIAVANVIYYTTTFFTKPPHIKYPAFEIDIPPGYAIHGIDVSRYQKVINWADVKDMEVKNIRIGFAFIKATEGRDLVDPQFSRNWLNASKEDIPKGAYHYFIAGKSGKEQAENFIEIVRLKKGDLPPVLDIEESSGVSPASLRTGLAEWLKRAEEEYNVKPVIYTNINFYNTYLKGSFEDYPVWIAHYFQPRKPRINRKWTFWQHSESGRVDGIKTMVDFNVFSGDSSAFKRLLIK